MWYWGLRKSISETIIFYEYIIFSFLLYVFLLLQEWNYISEYHRWTLWEKNVKSDEKRIVEKIEFEVLSGFRDVGGGCG